LWQRRLQDRWPSYPFKLCQFCFGKFYALVDICLGISTNMSLFQDRLLFCFFYWLPSKTGHVTASWLFELYFYLNSWFCPVVILWKNSSGLSGGLNYTYWQQQIQKVISQNKTRYGPDFLGKFFGCEQSRVLTISTKNFIITTWKTGMYHWGIFKCVARGHKLYILTTANLKHFILKTIPSMVLLFWMWTVQSLGNIHKNFPWNHLKNRDVLKNI